MPRKIQNCSSVSVGLIHNGACGDGGGMGAKRPSGPISSDEPRGERPCSVEMVCESDRCEDGLLRLDPLAAQAPRKMEELGGLQMSHVCGVQIRDQMGCTTRNTEFAMC